MPIGGYDLAYVEKGDGPPLLLVHGSLCDYRYWSLQMGPLSSRFRVIAVSLRHYYPERWDGVGDDFTIERHADDLAALIDTMGLAPAHVVGHSRGGRVAFELAHRHPGKIHRLVLAEPGGLLDASLSPAYRETEARFEPGGFQNRAFEAIRDGRIEEGLALFVDTVNGAGSWARLPKAAKQSTRDNAATLLGQVREKRVAYARATAEAIAAPTLLVLGARSPRPFGLIVDALGGAIPNARSLTIEGAAHTMNVVQADVFNHAVLAFLQGAEGNPPGSGAL
ncbi:MAG: alpha/beta hydrolase [Acetobacteraceae bacterium]